MNYTDRIKPENKGLTTYLDELLSKNYQIPTFQRDVVWEKENVKKLWDSIYKFYPLGSILIWKTNVQLQNHRQIGGHIISEAGFSRSEYQYILDGQQRTTSLLTSLFGGKIENRPGFDPTLFVDLTIVPENEVDDESYKDRFLFWDEIDDRNGEIRPNIGRKKRFNEGIIVSLLDIKNNFGQIEKAIVSNANHDFTNYDHPVREELRRLKAILDNYRISFIEVKGIQVSEVCQIFERINQAGKPLNIFDIIVAKTFRPADKRRNDNGFYLRELIADFRKDQNSLFFGISDLDYLQIIAVIVNRNVEGNTVRNITDRYLNELRADQITEVWEETKKAIKKAFDFFENHLHIKTPYLIPFRYFYFTITSYFYENTNPNYEFLKKYFWFTSFHNDDLLSNTTQLFDNIDFLDLEKSGQEYFYSRFLIDREKLRGASYSSKGRMSRAVLSLLASLEPKDWAHTDRNVLVQNFFFSTDKPNLHHIFPTNSAYVLENSHNNKINSDSLMNIAYITQITNLDITNRNPLEYIREFDTPQFGKIIDSHLLPPILLQWAREEEMPINALDQFIEARVTAFMDKLRASLNGIKFEETDTRTVQMVGQNDEIK